MTIQGLACRGERRGAATFTVNVPGTALSPLPQAPLCLPQWPGEHGITGSIFKRFREVNSLPQVTQPVNPDGLRG